MKSDHARILVSPAYLVILSLLLVNDFLLKQILHNWMTGKLSDFCGLFAFPLFVFVFFPRYKRAIFSLTALFFCFWKSGQSQPLIDAWNAVSVLPLNRAVDLSDAIALLILPFAYAYPKLIRRNTSSRTSARLVAIVSAFAFIATSFSTELDYNKDYHFEDSKIDLMRKVYHLSDADPRYFISPCESERASETSMSIEIPSDFCFGQVEAIVVIREDSGHSDITLRKMKHRCPRGKDDKSKLINIFEQGFINKLGATSIDFSLDSQLPKASESYNQSRLVSKVALYLVEIGEVPEVKLASLVKGLRDKYNVPITILPQIPLTVDVREPGFPTSRPVASKLVEAMQRRHSELAADPTVMMIGITEDMYISGNRRIYGFDYQSGGRFAMISVKALNPATFCEPKNNTLLESRLQKVLAKNVGMLCFRLPQSDNPRSVLYSGVGCVHELDRMGEDF